MKRSIFNSLFKVILVIMLVFSTSAVLADETISITGTVNEYLQIVTDEGEIYNIGDNEKAMELEANIGSKVEAVGNLDNSNGDNVIFVTEFFVIESTS